LTWGCGLLSAFTITAAAIGAWAAYAAGQEELNLHHTLYALQLVNSFVERNGRWPASWNELEAMSFDGQTPQSVRQGNVAVVIGGSMQFEWPGQAADFSHEC
jgi:hypothetical protein